MNSPYENVAAAQLPDIGKESFESFKKKHPTLGLPNLVEKINLQLFLGDIETFFKSVPSVEEIEKIHPIPKKELTAHLMFDSYCSKIALIQFEKGELPVSRKTDGYVSTRGTVINALLERAGQLLTEEWNYKFRVTQTLGKILEDLPQRLYTIETTPLGRISRFYLGLNEARRRVRSNNMFGTLSFFEIVEKRAWRLMELRFSKFGEVPTPQESNRRAEDAQEWKSIQPEVAKGKDVDWRSSIRSLGPFFTFRIMLRKELFQEVLDLVQELDTSKDGDFARALSDCETTLLSIQGQGSGKDNDTLKKIELLERIIELLSRNVWKEG